MKGKATYQSGGSRGIKGRKLLGGGGEEESQSSDLPVDNDAARASDGGNAPPSLPAPLQLRTATGHAP